MIEERKENKPDEQNKPDDWLPTLIGALVAMSSTLIAIIILFFFHGM